MLTDKIVFVAYRRQDTQKIIINFLKSAKALGLKINLKKRKKVMYQPPLGSYDVG